MYESGLTELNRDTYITGSLHTHTIKLGRVETKHDPYMCESCHTSTLSL